MTTGVSITRDREIAMWDPRDLSKPLKRQRLDSSTSAIIPVYDIDTNLLFLCSKGDATIRIFENPSGSPALHSILSQNTGDPAMGVGMVPKRACDLMKCEVVRLLKLTTSHIQPLRVMVPRKDQRHFQDDLYPNTSSEEPALSCADYFRGMDAPPSKVQVTPGHGPLFKNIGNADQAQAKSIFEKAEDLAKSNVEENPVTSQPQPQPQPASSSSASEAAKYSGETEEMVRLLAGLGMDINWRDPIAVRLAKEMLEEQKHEDAKREARVSSLSKTFGAVKKLKYVNGKVAKKDETYYNLTPEVNLSPTSALITASSTKFAIPWKGGGGPFYVSSLASLGKAEPSQAYTFNGHKSHVNDLQFHPFDESLIVSAGDDGRLLLWKVDGELSRNMVESDAIGTFTGTENHVARVNQDPPHPNPFALSPSKLLLRVLPGHSRSIRTIEFNPVANNVLLSTSMDGVVKLWDVEKSKEFFSIDDQALHSDLIVNSSFSHDGLFPPPPTTPQVDFVMFLNE